MQDKYHYIDNRKNNNKVFISSLSNNLDKILTNLYTTLRYGINENYTVDMLKEQLAEITKIMYNNTIKTCKIDDTPAQLGKMQSCAWLYINEYINKGIAEETREQLNKLLIEMSSLFENTNDIISNDKLNIYKLDVARDLNITMKLLNYPITFHNDTYGKHTDMKDLKKHNGKSYLRRPIAKAELALAWLSEVIYNNDKSAQITGEEKGFIKTIGTMFNVFLKRQEFIKNNKLMNPALDTLIFIRLMEIVYINCLKCDDTNKEKQLYKSFHYDQSLFKFIKDFNDIRLSSDSNSILSKLSFMPRRISQDYDSKYLFYIPVECDIKSPIYQATLAWENCRSLITSERNFKNVKEATAEASFGYELQFASANFDEVKESNEENQNWYKNQIIINFNDDKDKEDKINKLTTLKKQAKEELDRNGYQYTDIIFSVLMDCGDHTELIHIQL